MGLSYFSQVGYFQQPGSSGTQKITTSFQPKVVILFGVGETATGWSSQLDASIGIVADNSYCVGITTIDASTTAGEYRNVDTNAYSIVWNNTIYSPATCAFNSDGFTLTWSTVTANQYLGYLAIGGDDITNATLIRWQSPAGTNATYDVTSVGFQPDVVLTIHDEDNVTSKDTHNILGIGAFDSNGNQWAREGYSKSATTTVTGRMQLTDAFIVGTAVTTSLVIKASYVSMLSNGFRCNFSTNNSTRYYYSLCIKGGKNQVGYWAKRGTTGDDTITTTGILPKAVLISTDSHAASTSHFTGHRGTVGAGDGTNNCAFAVSDKTGVTTTYAKQTFESARSLIVADNDAMTDEAHGTLTTFTNDSFTAHWATNSAVSTQICYLCFGTDYTANVTAVRAQAASAAGVPVVSGAAGVSAIPARAVSLAGVSAPVEDACVIKLSDWPQTGTTVINKGSGAYNGTTTDNDFEVLPSGATSFHFDAVDDIISLPSGSSIVNSAHTVEIIFRLDSLTSNGVFPFFTNGAGEYFLLNGPDQGGVNGYAIKLAPDWSNYISSSHNFTVSSGVWYHLFFSWTPAFNGGTASLTVNDVDYTCYTGVVGTPTAFAADALFQVGNWGGWPFVGKTALVRVHTRILTPAEKHTNFVAEAWRYTTPLSGATISGAAGVSAASAQATATAPVPVASGAAGVTAVRAQATATAPAPVITTQQVVDALINAAVATAVASAIAPVPSGAANVTAVKAAATAAAIAPVPSGGAGIAAVAAQAVAAAVAPIPGSGIGISAVVAQAVAAALSPVPSGSANVPAVKAVATAAGIAPGLTTNNILSAVAATAAAAANAPTLSTSSVIAAAVAAAIAEVYAPVVSSAMNVAIAAAVAAATADAFAPTIDGDTWADVIIDAVAAEAIAAAVAPEITEYQGIEIGAAVAAATAVALIPDIYGEIVNVPYCEPEVDFDGSEILVAVLGGIYADITAILAREAVTSTFDGSIPGVVEFDATETVETDFAAIYDDHSGMVGILPETRLVGYIRCKT